jgi:hypothetical protein
MTYQLHLGIGEDLEEFLRAYASARGITIAAAVRILLYEARGDLPPQEISR